jgi:hypothetical protein
MKLRRFLAPLAGVLVLASPASTAAGATLAPTGTAGAAPAAAQPAAKSGTATGPSVLTRSAVTGPIAAATIVCTPTVQNPHKSTHVPGTVNVVVTLSCTSAVPQINIRAALYKNGLLVKDSGQKSVFNTAFAQHNAAVPCSNGTYQGWMSYGVLFPPGYVPQTGASSGFGNAVSITC